MTPVVHEYGLIGLGRMGGNIARLALEKRMRVVGFTRKGAPKDLIKAGLIEIGSLADFRTRLSPPRVVFVYIPAGPAVDLVLDELAQHLADGDIVVDGGNSYWGDSIRRFQRLRPRGIRFVDLGTSGGTEGARRGPCFMVGGEREAIGRVEPILLALATEGGYVHAGSVGAGHFTKLVHNGIEFGMLQAIAEGLDLLTHYHEQLDLAAVLRCWRHGSVIRGWLMDLMESAYRADPQMDTVTSYIEDTGEVNWLVGDAVRMEVPVPVISQSVMQLFASRDDRKAWARAIVMMRRGFGGHPPGPDDGVKRERQEGRVGEIFKPDRR